MERTRVAWRGPLELLEVSHAAVPMTPARWWNLALLVQYLVLAVLYAAQREWAKTLYWIGAAILSLGILLA